ncbi:MAG: nucleotidyltransferase substrate binding protein [Planctomycetes bacterium]|nr:nucleotidyltransferase substrate binding protein [Planctomycetota bacterium]
MTDIRWEQRFENLDRAFNPPEQGVELHAQHDLSDLEKEGIIQRFEYTFELAW